MAKITLQLGFKRAWWVIPLLTATRIMLKLRLPVPHAGIADWVVRHGYTPTIDGKPTAWPSR